MAMRRLRSSTVILGGMGALAAALTACSSEPDKRCVDRNDGDSISGYKVLSDSQCEGGYSGSSGGYGSGGRSDRDRSSDPYDDGLDDGFSSGGSSGGSGGGWSSRKDPQWYYGSSDSYRAEGGSFSKSGVSSGGFGCKGGSGG